MRLTELERTVMQEHFQARNACTPEQLAARLNVTLGEVREAEKTALRHVDHPDRVDADALAGLDLSRLEHAVVRARYCPRPMRTPEQIAAAMGVTTAEVLEAEKQAMSKLEDPAHATPESLNALGLQSA